MINLPKAQQAAELAIKKAEELGIAICVVVTDSAGNKILVNKMDGAFPVSDSIAYTKAFTSATLGMATSDMAAYAEPGKPYFGVNTLNGGAFTTIAGGIPVKKDGKTIGAVGVGGSYDVSQDLACAQAAAGVLEN